MTRRPAPLGEADLARLLRHVPDPPAPGADLTDRVVAAAVAAGNAGRPVTRRRGAGRPLWWAIAVIGVAGAVTAAAANSSRFEFARVLEWPQAIIRAAGWAPHHPHGPIVVRLARPATPPSPRLAAAPLGVRAHPTLPLTFAPRPLEPTATPRFGPRALVQPPRAPRLAHGPGRTLFAHNGAGARAIGERRSEPRPEAAFKDADRRSAGADLAAPAVRPAQTAAIATPARTDVDRPADDAFRFHDADEFARRQQADRVDWRDRAQDSRPFAAARDDQRRPWTRADLGQRPWQKAQAWRQRVGNKPLHPFRSRPQVRGRRR